MAGPTFNFPSPAVFGYLYDATNDIWRPHTGGTQGAATVQGNVAHDAADAGNPVKIGGVYSSATTLTAVAAGDRTNAQADPYGNLRVTLSSLRLTGADGLGNTAVGFVSDQGSNATANRATLAVAGHLFNGTSWDRTTKPNLVARLVSSAASTNATSVKASTGTVHMITAQVTLTSALRYLKLYDKASAPTVGTDTPIATIALPPSAATGATTVILPIPSGGLYMATGIAYALTVGSADADTAAVAAGEVVGLNIMYS